MTAPLLEQDIERQTRTKPNACVRRQRQFLHAAARYGGCRRIPSSREGARWVQAYYESCSSFIDLKAAEDKE